MNLNKYENLNPEEMLEFMEAERDFLNQRIEGQKMLIKVQNELKDEDDQDDLMRDSGGIYGEENDSATEFGMDYQKEMQNQ